MSAADTIRLDPSVPRFAYGFRRVFAFFLDHYLVGFVSYSIAAIFNWVEGYSLTGFLNIMRASSSEGVPGSDATWGLIVGLGVPYLVLAEWRVGRTVGKFLLGIRVVSTNNTPVKLWQAATRTLTKYPEMLVAFLFFIVFAIVIASGGSRYVGPWRIFGPPPRQRWGDQLAGTYVIRGPWKPVLVNRTRPASSKRDSAITPVRYPADGSTGIRLSGRKPEK